MAKRIEQAATSSHFALVIKNTLEFLEVLIRVLNLSFEDVGIVMPRYSFSLFDY